MEAVAEELMKDFTNWKKETYEINVNREMDKSLLEKFMKLRFEIDDISAKNIFNLLKAFHSPDPKKTSESLSVLQKAIACADRQQTTAVKRETTLQRKKRETPVKDRGKKSLLLCHLFFLLNGSKI